MAIKIKEVHAGDPISAKHQNQIISQVNRLQHIRSDGTIRVVENASGVVLSACLPPQPWWFQLTQNTPSAQGYVTVRRLRWSQNDNKYEVVSTEPEAKVYDRLINLTFDSITDNQNRAPSEWTKIGFIGRAEWAADRGQWQIAQIEHVARWINFQLTEALTSGDGAAIGSLINYWDGLDPTANGMEINLLTSPTSNYQASDGAKGTAVWRNDLDNSSSWQYQIIDLATDCPTT